MPLSFMYSTTWAGISAKTCNLQICNMANVQGSPWPRGHGAGQDATGGSVEGSKHILGEKRKMLRSLNVAIIFVFSNAH